MCQDKLNDVYATLFDNVHDWMKSEYTTAEARVELKGKLATLQQECRNILGLRPAADLTNAVPSDFEMPDGTPRRFKLEITQLGFLEDSQLKGPVQSYAVQLGCYSCVDSD